MWPHSLLEVSPGEGHGVAGAVVLLWVSGLFPQPTSCWWASLPSQEAAPPARPATTSWIFWGLQVTLPFSSAFQGSRAYTGLPR